MKLRFLMPALMWMPAVEAAAEVSYVAEAVVSSMVIDRGEQIGGQTFEAVLGIEKTLGTGVAYAALYRLTPFGGDQEAFADEFDYTLGYVWEGNGYIADVSANWLTYPGIGDEPSLELFAEVTLETQFAPTLAGFYDADFEDFGLEVSAGPEWESADWTYFLIGRLGFVQPGDGSANRSYGGVELGAITPVGDHAEFLAFTRYEVADEESFAEDISGGVITQTSNSGLAVGVGLAAAF